MTNDDLNRRKKNPQKDQHQTQEMLLLPQFLGMSQDLDKMVVNHLS